LKTRIISGAVITAILIAVMILGDIVLALTLLAVSLIAFFELMRALDIHKKGEKPNALEVWGYGAIVALYGLTYFHIIEQYMDLFMVAFLLVLLAIYVFTFPKNDPKRLMSTLFCVFYAPMMFSLIYRIRDMENGFAIVWLVFIGSWVSDVFAYFVGMTIGKHKLAPVLSPKKSIEGAVGGVAGSTIVGALLGYAFKYYGLGTSDYIWMFAVIGGTASIASQIGDLAASGIKRHYNVKDYGTLIPGHGGMMDRFDSVIMTAPIIYYLTTLFM